MCSGVPPLRAYALLGAGYVLGRAALARIRPFGGGLCARACRPCAHTPFWVAAMCSGVPPLRAYAAHRAPRVNRACHRKPHCALRR